VKKLTLEIGGFVEIQPVDKFLDFKNKIKWACD